MEGKAVLCLQTIRTEPQENLVFVFQLTAEILIAHFSKCVLFVWGYFGNYTLHWNYSHEDVTQWSSSTHYQRVNNWLAAEKLTTFY